MALTQVSESFFQVMGVELALGGGFPGAAGSADVAVLAHSVWTQAFGADPAVLGRTIYLSGLPYRVVGVAPPEVGFPGHTDVWTPQPVRWEFFPDAAGPTLIARLAPGADRSHAETLLQARTEDDRAEAGSTRPPTLEPLRGVLTEGVRVPLLVLMVAAALVFLLGCLNLAAMGVSHFLRRSDELQVRAALGAGRSRVLRQLVVEAIVVGTFGATAGLALASAGVGLLLAWLPADVPGLSTATIGTKSMLLAGGLAGLAALFINTVPALKVISSVRVNCATRRATENRRQARLRSGLIVGQVAVALLLVISAGLLGRSLIGLARTPLGIDVESVLLFETHLNHTPRGDAEDEEQYRARVLADRNRYVDQVREGIEGIPGVLAFGAVSQLPLSHDLGIGSRIRTRQIPDADAVRVSLLQATPGYFNAIGIRLVSGRSFSASHASTEREVVISQKAAESLFGTADPIGREVLLRSGRDWKEATVVGVVEEVRIRGPESEPGAQVYTSAYDSLDTQLGFAVRAAGDPLEIAGRLVRSLGDIAPDVPVYDLRTSRQALSQELSARQALALVSSLFAVVALILASIGIYAMIAEAVIRRRREIGIRIALGASVEALVGAVAWRGFLLASAGVLVAAPVVLGAGRLLDGVLYNVSSRDPWVLVSAPAVLLAVALLAAWIPARRAARVDPIEVLSAE